MSHRGLLSRVPHARCVALCCFSSCSCHITHTLHTHTHSTYPVEILYTKAPESDYLDAALITVMQVGCILINSHSTGLLRIGRHVPAALCLASLTLPILYKHYSVPHFKSCQIHLSEPEGDILLFLTGQDEIDR